MRPIRLLMSAFGPYVQEQILDFRELGANTFFLIHGPTGAGKSTLLDAICYALYGETSGEERDGKQMRSDLAEPKSKTRVVLDFKLGCGSYRVERVFSRSIDKSGKVGVDKVSATLWKRDGCLVDTDEGVVVATGASKVSAEVKRILGFESAQFRQVVLLPQGQFRRFLSASSVDREHILEALFQTGFYKTLQEKLKASFVQVEQERSSLELRKGDILSDNSVESVQALQEIVSAAALELSERRLDLERARLAQDAALNNLNQAKELAQRISELADSKGALALLQGQVSAVAALSSELEEAKLAETIRPLEDSSCKARATYVERKRDLAEAELAFEAALQAKGQAEERQSRLKIREPELLTLSKAIDENEKQLELVDAYKKSCIELAHEQKLQERQLVELSSRQEEISVKTNKLEDLALRAESLIELSGQAEHISSQGSLLSSAIEKKQNLARLQVELAKLEQLANQAKSSFELKEKDHADLALRCMEAETKYLNAQAGVLASSLRDNEPCPVCGSNEHPAPAPKVAGLESRETIERLKSEVQASQQNLDRERTLVLEAEGKPLALVSEIKVLEQNMEPYALESVDELEERRRRLRSKWSEANGSLKALEENKAERARLKAEIEAARLLVDGELQSKLKERSDNIARLKAENQNLPALDSDVIAKEIARLQSELKSLQGQIESAQEELRASADAWAKSMERKSATQTEDQRAEQEVLKLEEAFRQALNKSFGGSEDRYRLALRSPEDSKALEFKIGRHKSDLAVAQARFERAQAQLADPELSPPDLQSLHQAHELCKTYTETLSSKIGELGAELKSREQSLGKLMAVLGEIEKIDADYGHVAAVAKVCSGDNNQRMTLQRYVLSAVLEDVLQAASERLLIMSKKRYYLQRAVSLADKRTTGGLDMEVLDTYTGTARPVATLSGGESFLASLSLALGLADVVQAYSGGINLDTIFIDEGFGSLDPEALDLALRALLDLRSSGRLVGIISHVPELKERIDARLEVNAGRGGSRARFVLP